MKSIFELYFDVYTVFEEVSNDVVFLKIKEFARVCSDRATYNQLKSLVIWDDLVINFGVGFEMIACYEQIKDLDPSEIKRLRLIAQEFAKNDQLNDSWTRALKCEPHLGCVYYFQHDVRLMIHQYDDPLFRSIKDLKCIDFLNSNFEFDLRQANTTRAQQWLDTYTRIEDSNTVVDLQKMKNDYLKNKVDSLQLEASLVNQTL
jgi:hypothetical protein